MQSCNMVLTTDPDSKDIITVSTTLFLWSHWLYQVISFLLFSRMILGVPVSLLYNGRATNCCWVTSPFYRGGLLFIVGLVNTSVNRCSRLEEGICWCPEMRSQQEHHQGALQHLAGLGILRVCDSAFILVKQGFSTRVNFVLGDIWQCLEVFLIVKTGIEGCVTGI